MVIYGANKLRFRVRGPLNLNNREPIWKMRAGNMTLQESALQLARLRHTLDFEVTREKKV